MRGTSARPRHRHLSSYLLPRRACSSSSTSIPWRPAPRLSKVVFGGSGPDNNVPIDMTRSPPAARCGRSDPRGESVGEWEWEWECVVAFTISSLNDCGLWYVMSSPTLPTPDEGLSMVHPLLWRRSSSECRDVVRAW